MADKLKSCPFCGCSPIVDCLEGEYRLTCITDDCPLSGIFIWYINRRELVNAWNTRREAKDEVR